MAPRRDPIAEIQSLKARRDNRRRRHGSVAVAQWRLEAAMVRELQRENRADKKQVAT